jgi:hypothetical protein
MSEPSYDELKAELEKVKAQKTRTGELSFKVSAKGVVSSGAPR